MNTPSAYEQQKATVNQIIASESYHKFLTDNYIDLDTIRWLPPIAHNVDSAWAATGESEIQFKQPIGLYHCKSLNPEDEYIYTIAIYDTDDYGFYPNRFEPEKGRRNRMLSEVKKRKANYEGDPEVTEQ